MKIKGTDKKEHPHAVLHIRVLVRKYRERPIITLIDRRETEEINLPDEKGYLKNESIPAQITLNTGG